MLDVVEIVLAGEEGIEAIAAGFVLDVDVGAVVPVLLVLREILVRIHDFSGSAWRESGSRSAFRCRGHRNSCFRAAGAKARIRRLPMPVSLPVGAKPGPLSPITSSARSARSAAGHSLTGPPRPWKACFTALLTTSLTMRPSGWARSRSTSMSASSVEKPMPSGPVRRIELISASRYSRGSPRCTGRSGRPAHAARSSRRCAPSSPTWRPPRSAAA